MPTRTQSIHNPHPIVPIVGAYGKLPCLGDFVSVRANRELAASFQAWLARAVEWVERPRTPESTATFNAEPLAFAFRPPWLRGQALVGVLRGSRDAVGRRFPLAIFASLEDEVLSASPHIVPMIADAFLEASARVLDNCQSLASLSELEACLAGLPRIGDARDAAQEYEAWAHSTRARDVWRDFYGTEDGHGARFAVHTIVEALAPFGTEESPKTPVGVRVPIGAASPLAVAFWADIVRRTGGMRRREMPTHFWSPWWTAGQKAALVSLGEPHPSCPAEAALGRGDTDFVCDLTSASPAMNVLRGYAPLPSVLAHDLGNPEARVADLLDALGRPKRGTPEPILRPMIHRGSCAAP